MPEPGSPSTQTIPPGLDDQVVVARAARSGHEVDADRRRGRAVVGGRELVDDCRDVCRGVLRRLGVLCRLGGNKDFGGDCRHDAPLDVAEKHRNINGASKISN